MVRKLTVVEKFLLLTPPLALGLTIYWCFDPPWIEDALFRRSPGDEGMERLVQRTAGTGAVDCGAADAGSSGTVIRGLIVSSRLLDHADGCAINNFKANRPFRVKYSAYMKSNRSVDSFNAYSEVRAWSPRKGMVIVRHGNFIENGHYIFGIQRCGQPKVGYATTLLPSGFETGHETVGCP